MKFAVSSRQPSSVLEQCDEILVQERDHDYIFTLIEKFGTEKTIVLYYNGNIPMKLVEQYNTLAKNNFKVCIDDTYRIKELQEKNIKCFMRQPVETFYQLNALIGLGINEIVIAAPLFFDMDQVKATGVAVRAIANFGNPISLPHSNEVAGSWIRPNDIPIYEDYIDVVQFYSTQLEQEATLLKIYKQEDWPGDLGLIIPDLNYVGSNRYIKDNMTRRLNCHQRCMSKKDSCHYCYLILELAQPKEIKAYKDSLNNDTI